MKTKNLEKFIKEQILPRRRQIEMTPERLQLKKIAALLQFPKGNLESRSNSLYWRMRGSQVGYNAIERVKRNAESKKWKKVDFSYSTHPANDNVTDQDSYVDPTNAYKLSLYSHFGQTKYDNSYSITLSVIKK